MLLEWFEYYLSYVWDCWWCHLLLFFLSLSIIFQIKHLSWKWHLGRIRGWKFWIMYSVREMISTRWVVFRPISRVIIVFEFSYSILSQSSALYQSFFIILADPIELQSTTPICIFWSHGRPTHFLAHVRHIGKFDNDAGYERNSWVPTSASSKLEIKNTYKKFCKMSFPWQRNNYIELEM